MPLKLALVELIPIIVHSPKNCMAAALSLVMIANERDDEDSGGQRVVWWRFSAKTGRMLTWILPCRMRT